jgi:hypothetical protein
MASASVGSTPVMRSHFSTIVGPVGTATPTCAARAPAHELELPHEGMMSLERSRGIAWGTVDRHGAA